MSNSKRKILFLIESLDSGDAGKALSTLVQYIDKTTYDVTVCSINAGGQYESIIRENVNYKAILTGEGGMKHKMVYKNLPMSMVYKFYVPQGSDVEIAYSEGFATKLLSCSSNKKAKKYAWIHTDLHKNHWTREVFSDIKEETDVYNRFDKVLGPTNLLCEAFKKEFPNVKKPVETVYDPIDSLSVRLKSLNASNDNEAPVKYRLVAQGRLESRNEYGRLLRIVNRLVKESYDIGLWIFGDGSERGILDHYVKENNLQDRVKLFGAHPNPYRYTIQGNLFICSSFSSSVIKALILGLPVIATDSPELQELLKNGECGYIVPNNETALYEGIKKLLDDPQLLAQYRQKGEARGWDFDIEALMVPYENLMMG
ncbi:MAG: glycosyltransferase [Bacteroidaceae bacterium]|nr:glycosyltransferase [Bacteroidaceae bacterium]